MISELSRERYVSGGRGQVWHLVPALGTISIIYSTAFQKLQSRIDKSGQYSKPLKTSVPLCILELSPPLPWPSR